MPLSMRLFHGKIYSVKINCGMILYKKGQRRTSGSGGFAFVKDMNKVKCFACHKTGHYVSQCLYKEEDHVVASTSIEINNLMEKFEKEFYLVTRVSCNSTIVYEGNELWLVDSKASNHMTRMRSVFQRHA